MTRTAAVCGGLGLAVLVALVAGCSSPPPMEELVSHVREQHRKQSAPISLEDVELLKAEQKGNPPVWKMDVKLTAKVTADFFEPVSLESALADAQHDPQRFADAVGRSNQLREPERSTLPERRPDVRFPHPIFRRTKQAGSTFTVTLTVDAEQKNSQWQYFSDLSSVRIEGVSDRDLARTDLPKDAVTVEGDKDNPLKQFIRAQNEYIQKVVAAEKAMDERLARERSFLESTVQSGGAWDATIPMASGPAFKSRMRFAHYDATTAKVVVLAESVEDDLKRQTFVGALKLPAPGESRQQGVKSEGWQIQLTPRDEDRVWKRTTLVCGETKKLLLVTSREPVEVTHDATATSPPKLADTVAAVKANLKPGQIWEGLVAVKNDQAYKFRITSTKLSDDGSYVRVLIERPDVPRDIAVYEGAIDSSPEGIYGWAVQLRRVAGFNVHMNVYYPLSMIREDGRIVLAWNSAGELLVKSWPQPLAFRLKRGEAIADFQEAPVRWRTALKPGTRWSGTVRRGDAPAEKIMLTVADAKEEGRVYRVNIQNPDDAQQFRTFLATLDDSNPQADSFALSLKSTSSVGRPAGKARGHEGPYTTMLDGPQAVFGLRLTPDGKTLFSTPHFNWSDAITLQRDTEPVKESLTSAATAAAWKESVGAGSWTGTLTDTKVTVRIEVTFQSGPDEMGNLAADVRLLNDKGMPVPNVMTTWQGSLTLDDEQVHGFALKLKKNSGGSPKITSVILSDKQEKQVIYLRLDETRTKLIGMAGPHVRHWTEFLELTRGPAKASK